MCSLLPFVVLLVAQGAEPVSPNPTSLIVAKVERDRAEKLILKLGAEEFSARETAQRELAEMGRKAFKVLTEAATNNLDPEIRLRCRKLIPDAREADFKARVDTFLADEKNQYKHDLPGLELFFTLTGKTDSARTMYLEALKDTENRAMLAAADGDKENLAAVVTARSTQLYYRQYPRHIVGQPYNPGVPPTAMDVTLVLAVDSMVPADKQTRRVGVGSASYLLNNVNFRAAAMSGSGASAELSKKVVSHWIQTRTESYDLYMGMNFLTNANQKEEALAAAKKLLDAKAATGLYRGYAIATVSKFGGKDVPAILKPYLTDEAVVTTRFVNANERYVIQIRDVALAALITSAGLNIKDYGFEFQVYAGNVNVPLNATSNWFKTEDDRKAGFKKWAETEKKLAEEAKKTKPETKPGK